MKYRLLGKSGLKVSELCLGTMTFGEDWGWGASYEESRKMFDLFVQAGGNFIDTANKYTNGTSERYLGDFIKRERDRFVVATKYTLSEQPADPNAGGNHRKNLVRSLEGSLKRLKMEYIDLYWVHIWDTITPVEEVMRALDDQVRAGKVLYIGISDTPAWIIAQANTLATRLGWTPFIALQTQYNLTERTSERELFPMCRAFDIASTCWAPLAGGVLTGKYNAGDAGTRRYTEDNPMTKGSVTDRNLAIARTVLEIASQSGRSPAQVAINWIRQRREGVMIPIIGGRTPAQIADNLGSLDFELTHGQMAKLDEVSRVALGFPHDFIAGPLASVLVHGETAANLVNHRKWNG